MSNNIKIVSRERVIPFATPIEEFPHMQPDFYTKKIKVEEYVLDENNELQYNDDGDIITTEIEKSYEELYTRKRDLKEHFSNPNRETFYALDGGVRLAYRFEDGAVLLDSQDRIIARLLNRYVFVTLDKKWVYLYDTQTKVEGNELSGHLITFISLNEFQEILNMGKLVDDPIKKQLVEEVLTNPNWVTYLDQDNKPLIESKT